MAESVDYPAAIENETTRRELAASGRELLDVLMVTGDFVLGANYTTLQDHLDMIAPVRYVLTITNPPAGDMPSYLAEAWIGLRLPVRCEPSMLGSVLVIGREAIEPLRDNCWEAYEWWDNHYREAAAKIPTNKNILLSNVTFLRFDSDCGRLGEAARAA